MSREQGLWQTFKRNLAPYGKLQRIEHEFVPDVAYCLGGISGWVELKHLSAWPVRQSTRVRVPSLKREQADWLMDWSRAGGEAWCLLQVGREYLLLTPEVTLGLFERQFIRHSLYRCAVTFGSTTLPTKEIYRWLTRGKTLPALRSASSSGSGASAEV